jgi:hypothetical protein
MVELVVAPTTHQPLIDAFLVDRAGSPAMVLLKNAATRSVGTTNLDVASGDRGLPAGGTTGYALVKTGAGDYQVGWAEMTGGSGITVVEDDPNPHLGGDLDPNGHIILGYEIGSDIQAWSAVLDATTAAFTTALATKLTDLPTAASLTTSLAAKADASTVANVLTAADLPEGLAFPTFDGTRQVFQWESYESAILPEDTFVKTGTGELPAFIFLTLSEMWQSLYTAAIVPDSLGGFDSSGDPIQRNAAAVRTLINVANGADVTNATTVAAALSSPAVSTVVGRKASGGLIGLTPTELVDIAKPALIGPYEMWLPAQSWSPRISNPAATIAVNETTTHKINRPIRYGFDPDADQFIYIDGFLNTGFDGETTGAFIAKFIWSHTASNASANVTFGIQGRAFSNGGAFDQALGTAVRVVDTGGTLDTFYMTDWTPTGQMAGTAPFYGDYCYFQVFRDTDGNGVAADDNLAQEVRFFGAVIKLQMRNINDA